MHVSLRTASLSLLALPVLLAGLGLLAACTNEAPPMSQLTAQRDSLPLMTTYGVSKLISDSGVMRYRIIAEEWRMYDKTKPPRQVFPKGIFLQRLDKAMLTDFYITADTAWCYDERKWHLKGHVYMEDKQKGTRVKTDELYWDMQQHLLSSDCYTHVWQPGEELEGDRFRAKVVGNEPTQYHIWNAKGYMPRPEDKNTQPAKTDTAKTDTLHR